jgi:isoleucyl-tRNA synthetase
VRFGFTLGEEARRKLLAYWNLETFFATYADIDGTKVDLSALDAASLSPIDRWLIIKTNKFIREADAYYADFTTREIAVLFENFINDISNFYIRVKPRALLEPETVRTRKTPMRRSFTRSAPLRS